MSVHFKASVTGSCPELLGVKEKLLRSAGKHLAQEHCVCSLVAL